MTDTTNTVDTAEVDANMEASTGQAIGSLEHLDPTVLQIGENVRDAVDLGKEFLASLREHGVLVPITAVRDEDGTVTVRNGQRRTLGAREVGLATVPVYVVQSALATRPPKPSSGSCTRSSPTIRRPTSPTPSGHAASSR